eukprot:403374021
MLKRICLTTLFIANFLDHTSAFKLGFSPSLTNKSIFDQTDPDVNKSFKQIVEDNGFVFESHLVTTRDGYELKMFRIPGSRLELTLNETNGYRKTHNKLVNTKKLNKKVVLMQHGIFDSADCWISNTKEKSPAFILSKQGYDVWLGNSRGNKYSNGHEDPFITQQEFNDYSFQEMGDYDIPAMLQYIEQYTSQKKVAYIGHSQGTAQMFYALATNQEYFKDRISVFAALGPITALKAEQSFFLSMFRKNVELIMKWSKTFGVYDMLQPNFFSKISSQLFCGHIPDLCIIGGFFSDDNLELINDVTRVGVYFSHYPSGSSIRSMEHFSQLKNTGKFMTFDFGKERNLEEYGQEEPFEIPIEKITEIPIAMFVGTNDKLATQSDNAFARDIMKDGVKFYKEYPLGHLAFFTAIDMSYFQQDVVDILKTYHNAVVPKKQVLQEEEFEETIEKFLGE